MKRIFLLSSIFLALCATSFAQSQYGVKLGFYVGEVTENYGYDDPTLLLGQDAESPLRQPQLGVWWAVPLSNKIGLQTELLWVHKVWNFGGRAALLEGLIFDYLSLPVAATYRVKNWQLTLGPEVNFLLDQRFINPIIGLNEEGNFSEDFTLGLGGNIGVQYQRNKWIIGLRASHDLTAFKELLLTDVNGEPIFSGDYRHRGLTLWTGYQLKQ